MIKSQDELHDFIALTQKMSNEYIEDLGSPEPHSWIALGFWSDFFSLFKER